MEWYQHTAAKRVPTVCFSSSGCTVQQHPDCSRGKLTHQGQHPSSPLAQEELKHDVAVAFGLETMMDKGLLLGWRGIYRSSGFSPT